MLSGKEADFRWPQFDNSLNKEDPDTSTGAQRKRITDDRAEDLKLKRITEKDLLYRKIFKQKINDWRVPEDEATTVRQQPPRSHRKCCQRYAPVVGHQKKRGPKR